MTSRFGLDELEASATEDPGRRTGAKTASIAAC
jgi:hypothetical protein